MWALSPAIAEPMIQYGLTSSYPQAYNVIGFCMYYLLFSSNFLEIQWLYIAVMQLQYVHYSIYTHLSTHPHPEANLVPLERAQPHASNLFIEPVSCTVTCAHFHLKYNVKQSKSWL